MTSSSVAIRPADKVESTETRASPETSPRARKELNVPFLFAAVAASLTIAGVAIHAVFDAHPVDLLFIKVPTLLVLAGVFARLTQKAHDARELEAVRGEKAAIRERMTEAEVADATDSVQLSLAELKEYYTINKSQARSSFWFSVGAFVAGLLTLLAGIWVFYLRATPNLQLATISSAAGIVVQFIGATYLWLYRKSLDQLDYFYAQLVRTQDTMLAIKVTETIPDVAKQSDAKDRIVRALLERNGVAKPSVD